MDEVAHDDAAGKARPLVLSPFQRPNITDWSAFAQDARKALGTPSLDIISPSLSCNSRLGFGTLFDRLPREIISEIFVFVFEDARKLDMFGCDTFKSTVSYKKAAVKSESRIQETTLVPLQLSQVCRLWRAVAHSTPRIWTKLSVIVRQTHIDSALELIKLWVPRARACPLCIDVSFEAAHGPIVVYPLDWLTLFRAMAKAAMLLRDSTTGRVLGRPHLETHIRSGTRGTTPVVEERYFWVYGANKLPESGEYVPLLLRSSRKAVDEFGFEYHGPLQSSLTRLELQDTFGSSSLSNLELQIIISEFPKLEHLSAYLDTGDMVLLTPVVAHRLKKLRLSWGFLVDPGTLLDQLHLPALEELELTGDLPTDSPWMHLWNLIDRSRPPLRSLALEHFDGRAPATRFVDILERCVNLKKLWLSDCVLDNDTIMALFRRVPSTDGSISPGESVWSRLEEFGLTSCSDVKGDLLVEMIARALPTQLRDLTIMDCAEILPEHCAALDELFKDRKMRTYSVCAEEDII